MGKPQKRSEDDKTVAKDKGDRFEDFMAFRIKDGYECLERRSDKTAGYHRVRNNSDPDFVWESKQYNRAFATECKFRAKWWKESGKGLGIKLGKHDDKYQWYVEFAKKRNMPVFILIGISGEPDRPESVYIVPLDKVAGNFIPKSIIEEYRSDSPYGNLDYSERASECALFQGNRNTPCNWQRLFPGAENNSPKHDTRPPVNHSSRVDNGTDLPRREVVEMAGGTSNAVRFASPSKPSVHLNQRVVIASRAPARRFQTFSWVALLTLVATAFVWMHARQQRVEQADRQGTFVANQIATTPAAKDPVKPEPQPLSRSDFPLSMPAARAVPLLQYKTTTRPFRLSIERTEPASPQQIQLAADEAKRAVSLFEPSALPPFFAVLTEPSQQSPRQSAYMIFDTQTGSFCANEVYLTGSEQPARTVAIVHHFECFFVNQQWLTDEQGRRRP